MHRSLFLSRRAVVLALALLAACDRSANTDLARPDTHPSESPLGGPLPFDGSGPLASPGDGLGPRRFPVSGGDLTPTERRAAASEFPSARAIIGSASLAGPTSWVAWENPATGVHVLWRMDGTGFSGDAVQQGGFPTDWRVSTTGDLTGDGYPDMIWSNTATGERRALGMNGSTFTGQVIFLGGVPPEWDLAAVADLSGDGKPDVVWQNMQTGARRVWRMDGSVNANELLSLGDVSTNWVIAAVADFDGDAKADLLWQDRTTGDLSIWLLDGVARRGNAISLGVVPLPWRIGAAGDLSGDGHPDVLWENPATGDRVLWVMNGTSYASSVYYGVVPAPWEMVGVLGPPPSAPTPSVVITSVTKGGVAADLASASGMLTVGAQVTTNGAPITRVDLFQRCGIAAEQLAASQSVSASPASFGVTLAVATDAYDVNGTPKFLNGSCALRVALATASNASVAEASLPLTLANGDFVDVTVVPERQSFDAASKIWSSGTLTVRVTPVLYSAGAAGAGQVTLSATGVGGGTVTRTLPTGAPYPATLVFGTMPNGFPGVTDPNLQIAAAVLKSDGLAFQDVRITPSTLSFDMQAPTPGAYAFNTQGTANNWIGTAYAFANGTEPATGSMLNGTFAPGVTPQGLNDWGGVGRVTVASQVAPINTNVQSCVSTQLGLTFTSVTSGANLVSSEVNGIAPYGPSYCLRTVETDALGNAITNYVGVFGVDRENPTIVSTAGVASNAIFNASGADALPADGFSVAGTAASAPAATYGFTLRDTLSGFDATPLNYTVTRLAPGVTGAAVCAVGSYVPSVCNRTDGPQTVTVSLGDRVSHISVTGGVATEGYFTFTGVARDQAANTTPALPTRTVLVDGTAPVVTRTGANVPGGGFAGNTTAVFNFDGSDNVDLYVASAVLTYPAARIRGAAQQIGIPFDVWLTTSVITQSVAFANFYRSLTADPAVAGAKPTTVRVRLTDAATNEALGTARAIDPVDVANSTFMFGSAAVGLQTFTIVSAQTGATALTCIQAAACVVTVRVQGPTGTFDNPFAGGGVNLYYVDAAGELVPLTAAPLTSAAQTDDGASRSYTYTGVVGLRPAGTTSLRAIGFTSAGDAILSAPIAVTVSP